MLDVERRLCLGFYEDHDARTDRAVVGQVLMSKRTMTRGRFGVLILVDGHLQILHSQGVVILAHRSQYERELLPQRQFDLQLESDMDNCLLEIIEDLQTR